MFLFYFLIWGTFSGFLRYICKDSWFKPSGMLFIIVFFGFYTWIIFSSLLVDNRCFVLAFIFPYLVYFVKLSYSSRLLLRSKLKWVDSSIVVLSFTKYSLAPMSFWPNIFWPWGHKELVLGSGSFVDNSTSRGIYEGYLIVQCLGDDIIPRGIR